MSESDTKLNSLRKTMRRLSGQPQPTEGEPAHAIGQPESDAEDLQTQVRA